jgi:hypothetical protein
MVLAGTGALLISFDVPAAVRVASLAALGGTAVIAIVAWWVIASRTRLVSGLLGWLIARDIARSALEPRVRHIHDIEDRVYGFAARNPGRLPVVLASDALFHVAAVAEVWVSLTLISAAAPSLLTAFVLEYVNRVITIVFKFVPLRLGVDEAGTGLATSVLGLGSAPGVVLAIVRKARVLTWTAVGIGLLVKRGFSVNRAIEQAEQLAVQSAPDA